MNPAAARLEMIPGLASRVRGALSWRAQRARDRLRRMRWAAHPLVDRLAATVDPAPRVALVVVGRNDNYGGDFAGRLAATLQWNLAHPLVSEAVYVEWNPLAERPSDADWLVRRFPKLRVYVVSARRHERACDHPGMPLMEYFAKNVGIRRAQAPWIAVVNADVLIGPDMFRRMSRLRRDCVYGSHSVNIRWHGREICERDFDDVRLRAAGSFSADRHLFSVSGNFVLAHRDSWWRARGYDESLRDRRVFCDGHGVAQLYQLGARPRVLGSHFHLDHPESIRNARLAHQGADFDPWQGVPYANSEGWGQADGAERWVHERIAFLD